MNNETPVEGITPVDPAIANNPRQYSHISEEVVSKFMALNIEVAQLNPEAYNRTRQNLRVVLTNYIKAKQLPLRLFETKGVLYIQRTDLKGDGVTPVASTLKTLGDGK